MADAKLSGGGISTVFDAPPWQAGLSVTTSAGAHILAKRGVPDIGGNADPSSGYVARVAGTETVFGGTSAVAPLWAGLLARINASNGTPAGLSNPLLCANPAALNGIVSGTNGEYQASAGWDTCTGLGRLMARR